MKTVAAIPLLLACFAATASAQDDAIVKDPDPAIESPRIEHCFKVDIGGITEGPDLCRIFIECNIDMGVAGMDCEAVTSGIRRERRRREAGCDTHNCEAGTCYCCQCVGCGLCRKKCCCDPFYCPDRRLEEEEEEGAVQFDEAFVEDVVDPADFERQLKQYGIDLMDDERIGCAKKVVARLRGKEYKDVHVVKAVEQYVVKAVDEILP